MVLLAAAVVLFVFSGLCLIVRYRLDLDGGPDVYLAAVSGFSFTTGAVFLGWYLALVYLL